MTKKTSAVIHMSQIGGNGRISRLLTTLLLLKAGYTYVPYSSMESIIEARKDDYYHAALVAMHYNTGVLLFCFSWW